MANDGRTAYLALQTRITGETAGAIAYLALQTRIRQAGCSLATHRRCDVRLGIRTVESEPGQSFVTDAIATVGWHDHWYYGAGDRQVNLAYAEPFSLGVGEELAINLSELPGPWGCESVAAEIMGVAVVLETSTAGAEVQWGPGTVSPWVGSVAGATQMRTVYRALSAEHPGIDTLIYPAGLPVPSVLGSGTKDRARIVNSGTVTAAGRWLVVGHST